MLGRFQDWLSAYPTKTETFFLFALLFFLEITIITIYDSVFLSLCDCGFGEYVDAVLVIEGVDDIPLFELVFGVAAEEILFRIVPLAIALHLWRTRILTVITLLISSIIFGVLHGGVINIFIQGIGGLMYGIFFIKYSQPSLRLIFNSLALAQDTRLTGDRLIFASLMVIWLHFLYNVSLTLFYTALNGSISFPPLA